MLTNRDVLNYRSPPEIQAEITAKLQQDPDAYSYLVPLVRVLNNRRWYLEDVEDAHKGFAYYAGYHTSVPICKRCKHLRCTLSDADPKTGLSTYCIHLDAVKWLRHPKMKMWVNERGTCKHFVER